MSSGRSGTRSKLPAMPAACAAGIQFPAAGACSIMVRCAAAAVCARLCPLITSGSSRFRPSNAAGRSRLAALPLDLNAFTAWDGIPLRDVLSCPASACIVWSAVRL